MQHPQVAIVTGASSGIGRDVVRLLLERSVEVHAVARRVEAMRDLEARGALLHLVDLAQPALLDALVEAVVRRSGSVTILVNNAGYGAYGSVEEVPLAEARAQMEVNFFAMAALTQKVLPLMRERRAGRIVNVTSIGGKVWSPLGAWYHASKFAVEGFSDALRNEVRHLGIDVVVVEPGATKTEWAKVAIDNISRISGSGPYAAIAASGAKLFALENGLASSEAIAGVIGRAATRKHPKPRYVAPALARFILLLGWLLPDRASDWLFGRFFGMPRR